MKLTDKEIIKALNAGKMIRLVDGTDKYRLDGKDLSSLIDDRKDETDGLLSIATLGTSSLVKGVVKSIKKAGDELDE